MVEVAIVAGLAGAGLALKDCIDSIVKCAEKLKPWGYMLENWRRGSRTTI